MLCFLVEELVKQADKATGEKQEMWLTKAKGVYLRNNLVQTVSVLRPDTRETMESLAYNPQKDE